MKNIENKNASNVPFETTTFLVIVIAFTLLLFVIFVYINRRWKIFHVADPKENKLSAKLGGINIQQFESSSDSEEDISKYLRNKPVLPTCASNSHQLEQIISSSGNGGSKLEQNFKQNYYFNDRPLHITALPREKKQLRQEYLQFHQQNETQPTNLMSLVENGLYETVSSSSSEYIDEFDKQIIPVKNSMCMSKKFGTSSSYEGGSSSYIRTKSFDSESPPPSEQGMESIDDHIFEEMSIEEDVGSMQSSPCGRLELTFDFEWLLNTITVHVIQGNNVPCKDDGGVNNTQVRLLLLPNRKQKFKTKIRSGDNPQFMESFIFNIIKHENLNKYSLRLRLYGCERLRRNKLLGEYILKFNSINIELESTVWINFQPKYFFSQWDSHSETGSLARSESNSSTQSIQSGIPELLLGLGYNGTTGRLTVEAIKGSHLRNLAGGRAPDSYIKLVVLNSNGQELDRAKSSLRRSQSNPIFKETFIFQIPLFQIPEITLLISLYGRKGVTRRELLGWFSLGYNSSSEEETTHWEEMYNNQIGNQICRWHIFQNT